jgi:hypothetical protein
VKKTELCFFHPHDETKSIASIFAIKRGHNNHMASEGFTVDGKSKKSLIMTRNRETKRQKKLEMSGCKGLFCGFCGATKFFKEGSRVQGPCPEKCYWRDYGFTKNRHSEWKTEKPSQEEMNALNQKYRGRKQS